MIWRKPTEPGHDHTMTALPLPSVADAATPEDTIPVLTERLGFPALDFDTTVPVMDPEPEPSARTGPASTDDDWPSAQARHLANSLQGPLVQQVHVMLRDLIAEHQIQWREEILTEINRRLPALLDDAIRHALRHKP
jgi:hypothetical protein